MPSTGPAFPAFASRGAPPGYPPPWLRLLAGVRLSARATAENDLTHRVAAMDDVLPQRFFLEPACAQQRQYEALRAVFVEGVSQKEAARRFGYSHGAFRLLVQQFRAAC